MTAFLSILSVLISAATVGVSKAWITDTAHNKNTAAAIGFYTSFGKNDHNVMGNIKDSFRLAGTALRVDGYNIKFLF